MPVSPFLYQISIFPGQIYIHAPTSKMFFVYYSSNLMIDNYAVPL